MSDEFDELENIAASTTIHTSRIRDDGKFLQAGSKIGITTKLGSRDQGPLWRRQLRGIKAQQTRRKNNAIE